MLAVGADEHAGAAAAQLGGVESGAFERLPGGLQHQPLLGIHGEGLAGGDAEELRVEVGGFGQEAAFADVGAALGLRVGVVEAVEVPAAVGGEGADGVAAVEHQLPQLAGCADATGEAAGHADDGDGVVVAGGGGDGERRVGGLVRAVAGDQFPQVAGDGGGVGMVEDQGGGQGQAGGLAQPVAQFDGGDGVEAQRAEGPVGGNAVGVGVPEYRGDVGAHQPQQFPFLLLVGLAAQDGGESGGLAAGVGRGPLGLARAPYRGQFVEERAGPGGGVGGFEQLPVDVGDGEAGLVAAEGGVEDGEGALGV